MDLCLQRLKESNKSRFNSFSVRDSALIQYYVSRLSRANFFATTFLEIVCINDISRVLASSLIQYPHPVVQTAEFRVGHMLLCHGQNSKHRLFISFIYLFFFYFQMVGWGGGGDKETQHNCYKSQKVQAGSFYNYVRS